MTKKIRVNVIAEKFVGEANGVYTAIVQLVNKLKEHPEIEVAENGSVSKSDITHAHTIGLDYVWKSFFNKKKMIVSAHVVPESYKGSLIFSELWKPLATKYLKFVYERASLIVAVSPQVKIDLEAIGVRSEIDVLCNSVNRQKYKQDAEKRKAYRKKWGFKDDDLIFTCVGQIQPRKGIVDFIQTAKNCPEYKFVWVGGRPFGRLTADYDQMTDFMENPPENVTYTGIVDLDEMPGLYAMSDVYFMPSYQENFAFATIEASSVKLPLLLRDNIEYPSSLFDHYLKGKTADDFTAICKKLGSDKEYFKKWSDEADTLASKYTLKVYMDKLVSLYKKVLN